MQITRMACLELASYNTVDFVSFIMQQLREVSSVLTSYTSNQRSFCHMYLPLLKFN